MGSPFTGSAITAASFSSQDGTSAGHFAGRSARAASTIARRCRRGRRRPTLSLSPLRCLSQIPRQMVTEILPATAGRAKNGRVDDTALLAQMDEPVCRLALSADRLPRLPVGGSSPPSLSRARDRTTARPARSGAARGRAGRGRRSRGRDAAARMPLGNRAVFLVAQSTLPALRGSCEVAASSNAGDLGKPEQPALPLRRSTAWRFRRPACSAPAWTQSQARRPAAAAANARARKRPSAPAGGGEVPFAVMQGECGHEVPQSVRVGVLRGDGRTRAV